MARRSQSSVLARIVHGTLVVLGGLACTLLLFLVLPLLEAISAPPASDLVLSSLETGELPPPPPPPPEEEPEEKPEEAEEEPTPELTEQNQDLDLEQLALALNPSLDEAAFGGDFAVTLSANLGPKKADSEAKEELFSVADLDQKPRVVYQPGPVLSAELRRKAPGTVTILFTVDESGRVSDPSVQSASDPAFERSALAAVKQWKFEPGKKNGQPVRFRMRVPITFPAS
jgi:protein TonB